MQEWDHCLNCNNPILPKNIPVMYSGPIYHCTRILENNIQGPASAVGRLSLAQETEVRFLDPEPIYYRRES